MRRFRTAAAALTATALTATTAILSAPGAAAYRPVSVDVTQETVSKQSAPGVVEVTRSIVEVPGAPDAKTPALAYQYEMDPTRPEDSSGSACQLYRDGSLVLNKSCTFLSAFFEDVLKNPASGDYELARDGTKVSSWTYTAPEGSQPPALKPAGCRITGLKVAPKPRSITNTTDLGKPAKTYTMNFQGKRTGNCNGVEWSAYVTYSAQTPTGGVQFGFMTVTLTWSGKKAKTFPFTLADSDTKIGDYNFALQVTGITPGWRANVGATTEFTVKP